MFVSASNSETQGLTYIEAMAAGLPVVAREDSCLDGILEHGRNGYLFHNQAELTEGLNRALEQTEALALSSAAVRKAAEFSTESFATAVEKVYLEVVEQQRRQEGRFVEL